MKKYRIDGSDFYVSAKITEVEIERETDKSVWIKGNRFLKKGGYEFYDTWEEAQNSIETVAKKNILEAEIILEEKKQFLKK